MGTEVKHDQYEIVPAEDGTWGWRTRINGEIVDGSHGYELRRECIDIARNLNGDEVLVVTRQDGTFVREERDRKPDALRVVLLRPDGSEYGELDPPPSNATGEPQRITLTPATETGEAAQPSG